MAVPPSEESAQESLIRRLQWILDNRMNGKRRMSMRALSLGAGLVAGHVEQIMNRRQSANIEGPTAIGLARSGNVRLAWLLTGEGEPGTYDGDDDDASSPDSSPESSQRVSYTALRTPPGLQASESVRVEPPDLGELLDLAYLPTRHTPSDVLAVTAAIESGRLRLPPTPERMLAVRVWLDAAARLREKKAETSSDALVLEMTRELVRHETGGAPTKRAS